MNLENNVPLQQEKEIEKLLQKIDELESTVSECIKIIGQMVSLYNAFWELRLNP